MTDTNQLPPLPSLQAGDSHMESLIEAAIQGHASTRDAMRWLVRQLVPVLSRAQLAQGETVTDEQCIRAAVAAMPYTNPGVADDLIEGHTMHTEAEDIVAIWRAASGQPAQVQPVEVSDEQIQQVIDSIPGAWRASTLFEFARAILALRPAAQEVTPKPARQCNECSITHDIGACEQPAPQQATPEQAATCPDCEASGYLDPGVPDSPDGPGRPAVVCGSCNGTGWRNGAHWSDQQATPEPNPWREAVEEELTILHASMPTDPREAVKKLVDLECQIALDPDVSQQAAALVQRGRDEATPEPVGEPATIEDNSQQWAGMDGATAWHLIDRHADGWGDVGKMMGEWLKANTHPAPAAQAVPMTDEEAASVIEKGEADYFAYISKARAAGGGYTHTIVTYPQTLSAYHVLRAVEAHHGITAQAKDGGAA